MKAVLAALDMAKEADRLGDQLEARFGRRLTFGTGIHTGPAAVSYTHLDVYKRQG